MNEKFDEKEKLFTEQEAADYFNWSIFTMREIRKSGTIQYLIFKNKTVRYTLEQLQKYKNEHLMQVKTS
jgi:predicted site-specific integrase-resolvase